MFGYNKLLLLLIASILNFFIPCRLPTCRAPFAATSDTSNLSYASGVNWGEAGGGNCHTLDFLWAGQIFGTIGASGRWNSGSAHTGPLA